MAVAAGGCAAALALTGGAAAYAEPSTTSLPAVPAGDGGSSGRAAPPSALPLPGAPPPGTRAQAAQRGRRGEPRRRGGRVRAAWPHRRGAKPPQRRLARWLARHSGPVAIRRTRRGHRIGRTRSPANANPRAGIAQSTTASRLLLVRSFEIPRSDPQYAALSNFSWTYDNALAVFAFLSNGERAEAEQLLDQLRALQRSDGSLDFAYDVSTGSGAGAARAGSMAWVGLAAAAYKRLYNNSRYDALISGVLDYTLGLRTADGLVKGGTDVSWVSTQHNLLLVGMLRDLTSQIGTGTTKIGSFTGSQLNTIQNTIGNALLSKLLVQRGSLASFRAGVGDDAIPADVQALGALYLSLRGDGRSSGVATYLLTSGFFVSGRAASDDKGLVSGYRPYLDAASPNVIWSEGTYETAVMAKRLEIISLPTTLAVTSLTLTTLNGLVAPIGADRNVEGRWGEFHTWPASAAASWLLVLNGSRQLLYTQ